MSIPTVRPNHADWPTFDDGGGPDVSANTELEPGPFVHRLVEMAMRLMLRNPDMAAQDIVRRAIAEFPDEGDDYTSVDAHRATPHPAYGDELYPPAPFAELLRRAYAPDFDPREALLLALSPNADDPGFDALLDERISAAGERWTECVLRPFFAEVDAAQAKQSGQAGAGSLI